MKRNYTPIVSRPVDMDRLRRAILVAAGFPVPRENVSVKLPRDMEAVFPYIDLMDSYGKFLGSFVVRVNKTGTPSSTHTFGGKPYVRGSFPHRIFIMVGTRAIPAGRLNQAKL